MSIEITYHNDRFAALELCDQIRERLYEISPDDDSIRASHVHQMQRIIKSLDMVLAIMEERPCGSSSASVSD